MSINTDYKEIKLFQSGFLNPVRIRNIFKLGVPVFLGMLVQNLINITDNFMVGQMGAFRGDKYPHLVLEATNGLAALAPATMFIWLVAGFFACINVGTQAMVSRRQGEDRFQAAGRVVFNSSTIGFSVGTLVAVLGSTYLVPYIFPLFHNNPEVQRLGTGYCIIRFYSIPAWVATFAIKAFWDGIGRTYIHMVAAVIMTIMNLILNYLLIFGVDRFGIEPMGVMGAAWGSTCGTYIGFFIVFGWLFYKKYYKKYHYLKKQKWNLQIIKEVYRISIPSGIANIAIMTGFLFFTKVAGYLDDIRMLDKVETRVAQIIPILNSGLIDSISGPAKEKLKPEELNALPAKIHELKIAMLEFQKKLPGYLEAAKNNKGKIFNSDREKISLELKHILQKKTPQVLNSQLRGISFNSNGAATTIVISIAMIHFIGLLGFGQATATLVGQSLGRRRPDLAQKYGFESVTCLSMIYAIVGVFTFLFPEFFISIFTTDAQVAKVAKIPVQIWAFGDLFVASAMIFPQALFAAGHSFFVMVVEMILHFVCLIPLTYLFSVILQWGITGLWMAGAIYVVSLATVMMLKFLGHSWMSTELKG
jgi:putative MATE family efflux protein